jgi:putative SbcD/Mre11-related phosphoesterase
MRVHDEWLLTPQRVAVHLPTATAVLADLHLGYNEARCRDGDAVPKTDLSLILAPLRAAASAHGVRRVVIAGDLFESGAAASLVAGLQRWIAWADLDLAAVVPGNHDRGLAADPRGLPSHPHKYTLGRWRVVHGDGPLPDGPLIHGHEHPSVRWSANVGGPCYLVGKERIVLPAFSGDAAGVNVINSRKWSRCRCCVIAGDRVLDFGELAALKKRLGRGRGRPRPRRRDRGSAHYQ